MIWGGLKNLLEPYYGNIILKILLNAGKSPDLEIVYAFSVVLNSATLLKFSPEFKRINRVKITRTRGQSAGVFALSIQTSKASQRLNAGDPNDRLVPIYLSGFFKDKLQFSKFKHSSSLFEIIKLYLNVGKVQIKKDQTKTNSINNVHSINDLANVIIPHFDKYTLLTQKQPDLKLFKQIFSVKVQGKHFTTEGFRIRKILALKASNNQGLNEKFKQEFPNFSLPRPEVLSSLNPLNLKCLLVFNRTEAEEGLALITEIKMSQNKLKNA